MERKKSDILPLPLRVWASSDTTPSCRVFTPEQFRCSFSAVFLPKKMRNSHLNSYPHFYCAKIKKNKKTRQKYDKLWKGSWVKLQKHQSLLQIRQDVETTLDGQAESLLQQELAILCSIKPMQLVSNELAFNYF